MAYHRNVKIVVLDRYISVYVGRAVRAIVGNGGKTDFLLVVVMIGSGMKCSNLAALEAEVIYVEVSVCLWIFEE